MTVKVTVTRDPHGAPRKVEEHPNGTEVTVRDSGQLIVTNAELRTPKAVAIYAAGTWSSAVVEE